MLGYSEANEVDDVMIGKPGIGAPFGTMVNHTGQGGGCGDEPSPRAVDVLKVSSYTPRYLRGPRIQGNHVDLGNIG